MAVDLTAAPNRLHATGTLTVPAPPMSWACWFYWTGAGTHICLDQDGGATGEWVDIRTTSPRAVILQDSSTSLITLANGTAGSSVWNSVVSVHSATNNHSLTCNGTNGTSSSTWAAGSALDSMCLGANQDNGSRANQGECHIAEVAIWNVALSTAEVAIYETGVSPRLIRPNGLVYYWPIWNLNMLQDRISGVALTQLNSPGNTGFHSPMFYATPSRSFGTPTAGAPPAVMRTRLTLCGVGR